MLTNLMDRKTLLVAGLAFLIGLLIGWPIIGWGLWPVNWVDTYPWELRPSYKEAYVTMVADSLANNGDTDLAKQRLYGWPEEELTEIVQKLVAQYQANQMGLEAQHLEDLRMALGLPAVIPPEPTPGTGPETEPEEAGASPFSWVWIVLITIIVVVLAVAVIGMLTRRGAQRGERRERTPFRPPPDMEPIEGDVPLRRYVAAYRLGDTAFDESFSIEDSGGEFLGECGVAIGETLQKGTPDRVTALELWLFDKNDIRTVTKVLMSEWAYNNEELRNALATKGEPVLAVPGQVVTLETEGLRVKATIREVSYGAEAPAMSYFEQFVIDLDTFVKPKAG